MKSLQRLCAAVVLMLTLSLPAFAGDMHFPVTPPPPPPSSVSVEGGTYTPLASTGIVGGETATEPFGEVMLSLLQSVLALF